MDRKVAAASLMDLLIEKAKRRRMENEDFMDDLLNSSDYSANYQEDDDGEAIIIGTVAQTVLSASGSTVRKEKIPNRNREISKEIWTNGYASWDEEARVRITRQSFEFILGEIKHHLQKTPTNFCPEPIEPNRQLALTLYRLAHNCTYQRLDDVFGVSISLASETFNFVIRVLVAELYDRFVVMPKTNDEWKSELKGFIENHSFPCIGAWDGFHVQVASNLKNHSSFKHKYTLSNMGLVGHNKRFLNLTCNAPGSTHDSRLLRVSKLFADIQDGGGLPQMYVDLGDGFGEIPLVTVGDSAFPQFAWLVKAFPNTNDVKKRFFNTKLCGARVVSENAYGMLKGRWRILYKKCEARMFNMKYIIMSCVLLHNLCIQMNDPCNPRWKLQVTELNLISRDVERKENKDISKDIAGKIADWVWEHCGVV